MPLRRVPAAPICATSPGALDSCRSGQTDGPRSKRDSPPSRRSCVSFRSERGRHYHGPSARSGFTLIELLVTIAIIAALAAVVAPTLFGNVGQARQNAAKSQIQIL